jgi:3-mercaptopyruvate sulfurtransferase SseA
MNQNLIKLYILLKHKMKLNSENEDMNGNEDDEIIIVDTRNSNEYNGWKSFSSKSKRNTNSKNNLLITFDQATNGLSQLYDTKNGHITRAHNFDVDWLHLFDAEKINELLRKRLGLSLKNETSSSPTQTILILYDTCKIRLSKMKRYLVESSSTSIFRINSIYMCQLENEQISMQILSQQEQISSSNLNETLSKQLVFFQEPFFDMLLSPDALNHILLNRIHVDYKLFEISSSLSLSSYDISHIPTAVRVLSSEILNDQNKENRTALAQVLLDLGIVPNNTDMVILYGNPDNNNSGGGGGDTFSVALLIKWMGKSDEELF